MPKQWFVYLIETDKGNFYTGITTDLKRRYQEHQDVCDNKPNAKGAKFFRSQRPKKIAYSESFNSRSCASRREADIKSYTKLQKQALISGAFDSTSC